MKQVLLRILITVIGTVLFALVMTFEIDGTLGFLLATFGFFLIIVGLTFKGLVKLLADIL